MKGKKIFLILVFGLAAFALGMFADVFLRAQQSLAPAPERGFPLTIVNVNEAEGRLYEIKVSYPSFPSLPESFDSLIRSFVEANIETFKVAARDSMEARIATLPEAEREKFVSEPFYLLVSWTPAQISDNYVSFVVRVYAYEGGANGREELATFNYDVKKRKEVTLRDLFPEEGDGYLEKVSKASRESLLGVLGFGGESEFALGMLEEGTKPTEENFRHFTFTDDAVIIYFEKYRVAPGSFGEQRVAIPRVIVR